MMPTLAITKTFTFGCIQNIPAFQSPENLCSRASGGSFKFFAKSGTQVAKWLFSKEMVGWLVGWLQGCILRHINPCRLFEQNSVDIYVYIYIYTSMTSFVCILLNGFGYCYLILILMLYCRPVLVMEPNVVWLLVTVLVVAVVFLTTTLASDCLLCQVLPSPRCVWKIHEGGLTQFSRFFFWR